MARAYTAQGVNGIWPAGLRWAGTLVCVAGVTSCKNSFTPLPTVYYANI